MSFTLDGSLPIDNNDTKRDLRRLTIGRKNWLFIGSPTGGGVSAVYTLIRIGIASLDLWAERTSPAGRRGRPGCVAADRWRAHRNQSAPIGKPNKKPGEQKQKHAAAASWQHAASSAERLLNAIKHDAGADMVADSVLMR